MLCILGENLYVVKIVLKIDFWDKLNFQIMVQPIGDIVMEPKSLSYSNALSVHGSFFKDMYKKIIQTEKSSFVIHSTIV